MIRTMILVAMLVGVAAANEQPKGGGETRPTERVLRYEAALEDWVRHAAIASTVAGCGLRTAEWYGRIKDRYVWAAVAKSHEFGLRPDEETVAITRLQRTFAGAAESVTCEELQRDRRVLRFLDREAGWGPAPH